MLITFVNFILQEGLAPIKLIIEDNFHRAAPGGTGGVKTIGNYASVTFYIGIIFHCFDLCRHPFVGKKNLLGHHLLWHLRDAFSPVPKISVGEI